MVIKRVGLGFIVLAVMLSLGARRAEAASIDFLGLGSHSIVNVIAPVSGNVYAGELEWAWVDSPPAGFAQTFTSFCIDIKSYLVDPQTVVVESTDDFNPVVDAGGKAAWLVQTFASSISGAQANVMAAALQVAIWEVVYDTTNNLLAGTFILGTGGDILTQAQIFLSALYSPAGSYHTADGLWLDTDRGQDQIVVPTPEPATLSLLALGACLMVGVRNRRIEA
jgi:hypothetical protein